MVRTVGARQVDVASLNQWAHGPTHVPPCRLPVDGQQAGNLVREHLNNRRSVGFVLDQFGYRVRPFSCEYANGFHGRRAVHTCPHLIEKEEIGSHPTPDLADNVV
jgi:hypothetical protein